MKEYKFYLLAAVPTAVVAGLMYFVDATGSVKTLVVSNVFALFVAWITQARYDRKVVLIDKIMAELHQYSN
jgi:hypothetical protein